MQRREMVLIGQLAKACNFCAEDKRALIKEYGAIFNTLWLCHAGANILEDKDLRALIKKYCAILDLIWLDPTETSISSDEGKQAIEEEYCGELYSIWKEHVGENVFSFKRIKLLIEESSSAFNARWLRQDEASELNVEDKQRAFLKEYNIDIDASWIDIARKNRLRIEEKHSLIKKYAPAFYAIWVSHAEKNILSKLKIPERYFDISHWSTTIITSLYNNKNAMAFLKKIYNASLACKANGNYDDAIDNLDGIEYEIGMFEAIADKALIGKKYRNRNKTQTSNESDAVKEIPYHLKKILFKKNDYIQTPIKVKDWSIVENEDFADRDMQIGDAFKHIPVMSIIPIDDNRKCIEAYFVDKWLEVMMECITDMSFIERDKALLFINGKNKRLKFDIEYLTRQYADNFFQTFCKLKQTKSSIPQNIVDMYEFEISRIKKGRKYLIAVLRNAQGKEKQEIAIELDLSMNGDWKSNVLKYIRLGRKKAEEIGLPALEGHSGHYNPTP